MVRYRGQPDLQTKALFRHGALMQMATSQQLCDAVYKKLCTQRFFTHHRIERVTVNQFIAMLAVARLKRYDRAA